MKRDQTVLLGFAVGSGEPVNIPLAHTFVTGQTRLSGKTTALRAIVMRSGRRALAFVTKRGEDFEGRRIRPYLPREGDRPIHWRLVETIVASAMGMKHMARERWFILNAAKGAKSLQAVRDNVARLQAKAKGATAEQYEMVGEYLDLVLPEMRELNAAQTLDLQPGLNVIDISDHSAQLQAMVIRACLEHINRHEEGVLTVFPEAWEFAPRGRKTPASDEAMAMARKGGVLGNWLLSDSQDIAGVDTTIRQATSNWILGVQRELNELNRTLKMIPANIKKPKAQDITSLELGQFVACWGNQAVRTYVQPAWMDEATARLIAMGQMGAIAAPTRERIQIVDHKPEIEPSPVAVMDEPFTDEDDMSKEDVEALKASMAEMADSVASLAKSQRRPHLEPTPGNGHGAPVDEDAMYERFKARLMEEKSVLLKVLGKRNVIEVDVETVTIQADGKSLRGRLALLLKAGWFDEVKTAGGTWAELKRTGTDHGKPNVAKDMGELVKMGFLQRDGDNGYLVMPDAKANIKK